MIVLAHIAIAFFSIGLTSYVYFRPSKSKLHVAYGAVALTLLSGIYLVWSSPTHMIEACTMGLLYIGIVSIGIVAARAKLVAIKSS